MVYSYPASINLSKSHNYDGHYSISEPKLIIYMKFYWLYLVWDLLFHSPGWFYCSCIRLRLEITLFHSPQAPGRGTGCRFLSLTGAVAVGSVKSLRFWHQAVLAFFAWIHFYMFPKSYMMVTKAPQDPNWLYTWGHRIYFSVLLVKTVQSRSHTLSRGRRFIFHYVLAQMCIFLPFSDTFSVYLRPNVYIYVQMSILMSDGCGFL